MSCCVSCFRQPKEKRKQEEKKKIQSKSVCIFLFVQSEKMRLGYSVRLITKLIVVMEENPILAGF